MHQPPDIQASLRLSMVCALCVLASTVSAVAGDVTFTFTQRETFAGSPSILTIVVRDADKIGEPSFPTVTGVDFETQPGRQTMSSMQFINGKSSSTNTTAITVMLTPSAVGIFQIPPVTIVVDGVKHASRPTSISSVVSTTGDLLSAHVIGTTTRVWIGQPIPVTLRILVKPFRSDEYQVTLKEGDMWRFIDGDRSEFGPFSTSLKEMAQRGQHPLGREELIDGHAFLAYDISATISPASTGTPDFSEIRIAWNYPVRLAASRGFFGRNELEVAATKPIATSATSIGIDVRPLPTEGQPSSFRGAVGSFAVASSAKPLTAAVGDPITLTLIVTDLAKADSLGSLAPPALDTPAIAADFRMPSAPLAGIIDGHQKSFTQTIRPTHTGVKQIPAIEFAWFDPTLGGYRTASTKPIDLTVVASEHIATDAIIAKSAGTTPAPSGFTATSEGLVANAVPTLAMMDDQSRSIGMALTVGALSLPPLVCGGIVLLQRRRERRRGDIALSRCIGASRTAMRRIASGDIAGALTGYLADRLNRTSGTLTRGEARRALVDADAPIYLQERVDALLRSAERAQFGSATPQDDVKDEHANALAEARSCVTEMEGLSWTTAREVRAP